MTNRRRLVLVNPVNPVEVSLAVNRLARFPPLGLGILAGLTPRSWEVELADENWRPFTYREADLVGITALTSSANRAYEIAAPYRARGIPVVMGGIHASMRPEEARQFVDTVVIGEAETIWPKVMADAESGHLEAIYRGEWPDLVNMPQPRRDLFHPGYKIASIQTARGCPMDCDFCSVSAFNERRYRRRPLQEVLDELETIPQKMIFFVDDNIVGCSRESREQALMLFRGMVERRLNKWWFCQASLNFADDEELPAWAGRAGCKMVFLGVEAEKADALAEVGKQVNLERGVRAYEALFRRIHRAGIAIFGGFIFGMDSDAPESLHHRMSYMVHSGIDAMQPTFLTPLPGTRLFDRFQRAGRLLYTDFPEAWDRYDFSNVVYRPKRMAPEVLSQTVLAHCRQIYAWPMLVRKAMRTLRETRSPVSTWFAWQANAAYRNVALAK